MIVLDTTIVNVALPSIRADLGFSQTSLAWVVNAYLLTFGGFLLLGGRLGDLFGHRRLFLLGHRALHARLARAAASRPRRACSMGARAVQGVGGAVVSAVALSLIMTLFTEPAERAKAMGVFGFVASGGGSDRRAARRRAHRLARLALDLPRQPPDRRRRRRCSRCGCCPAAHGGRATRRLDVAGAVTVTAALMLAVYAIVNGNQAGWTSGADARPARRPRSRSSRSSSRSSRASRAPLDAARALPAAQRRDRERRRRALGRGDVRVVLPLGALPAARARLQPAARSASRSCRPT